MRIHFIIILVLFLSYCQSNSSNKESAIFLNETLENFPDNKYCANVQYNNPRTGTHSTYRLTVNVADNKVIQLDFPNGGVLDEDHFNAPVLNEEGEASFTNDKGYEYEVLILGQTDNCFDGVPMAEQCEGTTRRGLRCKHLTDNANKLCWQHQNQER